MIYFILFISALVSATLFPLGSEALFIYDITQGYSVVLLLVFATLGNTLGSCINYYLGLKGEAFCEEKNYIKQESISKYKKLFDKFGIFALLLSWMPIIGDPITFIAGILKYNFKLFFLIVLIAKFSRYALLAYFTLN